MFHGNAEDIGRYEITIKPNVTGKTKELQFKNKRSVYFLIFQKNHILEDFLNDLYCAPSILFVLLHHKRVNVILVSHLKFIYSEKATQFCEIFTLFLTTVHTVKSKVKISQNVVAFSEYMSFTNVYYIHFEFTLLISIFLKSIIHN